MAARYADSWKVQFATSSASNAAGAKLQNQCCTQLHKIGYYMKTGQKIFKGDSGNKARSKKTFFTCISWYSSFKSNQLLICKKSKFLIKSSNWWYIWFPNAAQVFFTYSFPGLQGWLEASWLPWPTSLKKKTTVMWNCHQSSWECKAVLTSKSHNSMQVNPTHTTECNSRMSELTQWVDTTHPCPYTSISFYSPVSYLCEARPDQDPSAYMNKIRYSRVKIENCMTKVSKWESKGFWREG